MIIGRYLEANALARSEFAILLVPFANADWRAEKSTNKLRYTIRLHSWTSNRCTGTNSRKARQRSRLTKHYVLESCHLDALAAAELEPRPVRPAGVIAAVVAAGRLSLDRLGCGLR